MTGLLSDWSCDVQVDEALFLLVCDIRTVVHSMRHLVRPSGVSRTLTHGEECLFDVGDSC